MVSEDRPTNVFVRQSTQHRHAFIQDGYATLTAIILQGRGCNYNDRAQNIGQYV